MSEKMANNIAPDKLIFNLDKVLDRTPVTVNWFINDVCNNKCVYCSYSRQKERMGKSISILDFKRYSDRLKQFDVRGIVIEGGGEPTICQDFKEMMNYLNQIEIPYILLTNWNVYHEIKPEVLRISLDAWNETSYMKKRGVERYAITRANIEKYIKWKKINSPSTDVGIQLVVEDVSEIEPFYEGNADLDVDYIQFKPFETVAGTFYENKDADIKELNQLIQSIASKDKRILYNYKWKDLRHGFDKCYAHANQMAIDWNGDVMVCCHRPSDYLGNIMDPDILEKNRQIDFDMSKCAVPCRLTGPNAFIERISKGCRNQGFI